MSNELTQLSAIAKLNDEFRQNIAYQFIKGQVLTTASIASLPDDDKVNIIKAIREYDSFTEDNDPYGEHDFGLFKHNAETIFWKIDYYDNTLSYGSENPADPNITKRIMTVMFAYEY